MDRSECKSLPSRNDSAGVHPSRSSAGWLGSTPVDKHNDRRDKALLRLLLITRRCHGLRSNDCCLIVLEWLEES
jgi:hypothetical protein